MTFNVFDAINYPQASDCCFRIDEIHALVPNSMNMDIQATREKRLLQVNEPHEFQNEAYEKDKIYKRWTKAWHDKFILRKEFMLGQHVLLFNSKLRMFPEECKSKWSRSFTITKVFPYGVVEVNHPKKRLSKLMGSG